MSKANAPVRRERVERNIYRSRNAAGREVYEVGYRDSLGKQRWKRVDGGISAARSTRDDILGRKARHERVQPNPRLRFGEAADRWLRGPVASLRPATRQIYRNAVDTHLRPAWGRDRLDSITGDDVARLVRDMRASGKAEWTISGVVKAASQIFRHANARLGWHGINPTTLLANGERPKTGATVRRRIYQGDELTQTLRAAHAPYRTLFALAAVTGGRLSELLGLTWADVTLDDINLAEVRFEHQVDRAGQRVELKTEESRRTVEIPRQLAAMLAAHKLASTDTRPDAFVFATRSGRALSQRNVLRALRATQLRAVDDAGKATFPLLHEDKPPKGAAPSFHGFRHTAASEAIAAGDGAEEVSWQLGHKNSVVTRSIYVQEIKSAERTAKRRAKMDARYGSALEAIDSNGTQQTRVAKTAEVRTLRA